MDFKKNYEDELITSQERHLECDNYDLKPTMVTGIISPESTVCVQSLFGMKFELDRSGMKKIIGMFEDRWNTKSEEETKNLFRVLSDIYSITEEYLGGHGDPSERKRAYDDAKEKRLTLSQIEGKRIGCCAERAAIGHQLLSILQQSNCSNYESYLTFSHLTRKTSEPHVFIILKHNEDTSKQFLFDIENPLEFQSSDTDKPITGIALYHMTKEEWEAFKSGKNIKPKSIYEEFGMSLVGEKRAYGNEENKKHLYIEDER